MRKTRSLKCSRRARPATDSDTTTRNGLVRNSTTTNAPTRSGRRTAAATQVRTRLEGCARGSPWRAVAAEKHRPPYRRPPSSDLLADASMSPSCRRRVTLDKCSPIWTGRSQPNERRSARCTFGSSHELGVNDRLIVAPPTSMGATDALCGAEERGVRRARVRVSCRWLRSPSMRCLCVHQSPANAATPPADSAVTGATPNGRRAPRPPRGRSLSRCPATRRIRCRIHRGSLRRVSRHVGIPG
jgi:hypothetical protein